MFFYNRLFSLLYASFSPYFNSGSTDSLSINTIQTISTLRTHYSFYTSIHPYIFTRSIINLQQKRSRKIQYVLTITTAQDTIFSEIPTFNLFRNDPCFFWFMHSEIQNLFPQWKVTKSLITTKEPKIIPKKYDPFKYYKPDKNYPDLLIRST